MNTDLAYRVLDYIEANPTHYSHETEIAWVDPAGYLTEPAGGMLVASFEGWTCLLSGDQPAMDGKVWSGEIVTADGFRQDCGERAFTLLDLDADADEDVEVFCYEDVDTLDKLRTEIARRFGPRPGGA